MAYTLSIKLKGEGKNTTRRVQVAGTSSAQAITNAATVLTWYDGVTSMKIVGASLSGKMTATATIPTDPPSATSRVNRVLRTGIRYDSAVLNKAHIEVPSVQANQVENGIGTAAAETVLAGWLIPDTLSVHGDPAQLINYTRLDYTKARKRKNNSSL